MSNRLRLTLIFTFTVVILLSSFSAYIYYSTVYIRKNAFYDRLWERADILGKMLADLDVQKPEDIPEGFHQGLWTILPEEEIAVYFNDHGVTYIKAYAGTRLNYEHITRLLSSDNYIEEKIGNRQLVAYRSEPDTERYSIIISAYDRNGQRLLNNLKLTLITAMLVFIFIVLFVGWVFSGAAFRPVMRIIQAAEKIGYKNMHLRVPIPRGKGELARLTTTINDSLDRLQTTFEIQKSFVASASHELRNPLTALQGNLEIALLQKRSREEYERFIASAAEDAKRLGSLLNNLLLLSQTYEDEKFFEFSTLRIDEVILDILDDLHRQFPERMISFNYKEMPQEESGLMVRGNKQLLHVAFMNLADNAIKYSQDNTPIKMELFINEMTGISICDEGTGIPQKDIEHVFEPFFRSKRTSAVNGYGIGLTLARQIIELHAGTITLKSRLNIGTTVTVKLPSTL